MITKDNYYEVVKGLDFNDLPEKFRDAHQYVNMATQNGENWQPYETSAVIKETIDDYFSQLQKFLDEKSVPNNQEPQESNKTVTESKSKRQRVKGKPGPKPKEIDKYAARAEVIAQIKRLVQKGFTYEQAKREGLLIRSFGTFLYAKENRIYIEELGGNNINYSFDMAEIFEFVNKDLDRKKKKVETENSQMVERISDEVRFIKRYALMHEKIKTPDQIRNFINALQKAILEKRIRKTSDYAEDIRYIQERLITWFNTVRRPELVRINPDVLEKFRNIVGSQKILLSAAYLKRYIGMQGKYLDKEKAKRLRSLISNALDKNKIAKGDPYYDRINAVLESLKKFTKSAKENETLVVHPAILNGIQNALDGIEETPQNLGKQQGYQEPVKTQPDTPTTNLVSSVDFEQMKFPTLGFMGKWYNLIGDPVKGFIAMIFGKPKMGKSYLAIDFAGYLAEYFGKTLYVSREEGFGGTLQQKIREKNAAHPNLFIAHEIPKDLSAFDFVIFDSATRLNLEPDDIRNFKAQYPGASFIYVFQAIKDGNFRGSQEFEHDVDIVIDVYAKGKARQYGRFNQGGEMEIFESDQMKEWPMAA